MRLIKAAQGKSKDYLGIYLKEKDSLKHKR
jgi:hypothetical protein